MEKSLDTTELLNRESNRVSEEVMHCLNNGFQIWHWWDGFIEEGDQVKEFGMMVLVKPHGGRRKNTYPKNMGKTITNLL